MDEAKPIGEVAAKVAALSPKQSTKDLNASSEHKRIFLQCFRRWEMLFKRRDSGDVQAEKWLIAEYYESLKHLSAEGFIALTTTLKEACTFFPTIRECLDATKPADRYDYGHPFLNRPELMQRHVVELDVAAPIAPITDRAA